MGKYDGPHFQCEDRDVVSIWIAHTEYTEIPDDYMEYNRDDRDDTPWSRFTHNFGFGYYDDDFVESYLQPTKQKATIYEQLKYLSYSASFIEPAVEAARKRGLGETSYVFLMYNFAYDPKLTKIHRDDYLDFLGVFAYDRDSDSAEQWQG